MNLHEKHSPISKFATIVFISSVLLSGCEQKHTINHAIKTDHLAMDLIQPDRFAFFQEGYVVFVENRSGTNLQNIVVYRTVPDGNTNTRTAKMTIYANAGTVSPDVDRRSLKLSLQDARCVAENMAVPHLATSKEMVILLRE